MNTALVTGANRGIGFAITQGLAKLEDITVLAASRRETDALATASEVGGATIGIALASAVLNATASYWIVFAMAAIVTFAVLLFGFLAAGKAKVGE